MAWSDEPGQQPTTEMPATPGMPGMYAAHEPVLVTLGDIACSQHYVVTPAGPYPIAGTTWIVTNQTVLTEKIPAYAIVLAVVFALFCLLGLFFLLIKERSVQGFVQVSVQGPNLYYATQVPISHAGQIVDVERRVSYARSLAAVAAYGA